MRIIGNDPSIPRQAQIVASGTLSTGATVVVNADGTVSAVAATTVTEASGSAVVFESAEVRGLNGVYDSNANRIVLFYRDVANTNYPTAVVGTVSGTSISFGTPVVIASVEQYAETIPAVFVPSANKIVFVYTNASFYGAAIVGTVSGTSISFGTPNVFDSGIFILDDAALAYDSGNDKVVIVYQNYARVGTVSGTNVSFGSRVTFRTTNVGDNGIAYDPVAGKVVVVFSVNSGSPTFQGEAIVGTVSGSSISFGTAVSFAPAGGAFNTKIAYHSASGTLISVYTGGGNAGTAIPLSVAGTSIIVGGPQVFSATSSTQFSVVDHVASGKFVISFYSESTVKVVSGTANGAIISFDTPFVINSFATNGTATAYDSNQGRVVVGYTDGNNSSFGTSKVYSPAYTTTNLTATNFIGTVAADAASAQRAKINLKGAVDENQSGLTAGQSYYVQTDGTLSATAGTPSVFAGTAVAATKLIVKG